MSNKRKWELNALAKVWESKETGRKTPIKDIDTNRLKAIVRNYKKNWAFRQHQRPVIELIKAELEARDET